MTPPCCHWHDPAADPPPRHKTLLLLTATGSVCLGHWADEGFIAWSPLPAITPATAAKIQQKN
jgi:hypothetical protein